MCRNDWILQFDHLIAHTNLDVSCDMVSGIQIPTLNQILFYFQSETDHEERKRREQESQELEVYNKIIERRNQVRWLYSIESTQLSHTNIQHSKLHDYAVSAA